MLVLFETSAGYAVFKLMDEKKLQKTENLYKDFETPERANKVLSLKQFKKFQDTTEALAMATAAVEGKMSKALKKMLKKLYVKEAHETLAVADAKLGNAIKDKLGISCVTNSSIQELMRCIRSQVDSLISGLPQKELAAMSLGLAHSLSRYKLKFSPDKVDTMIVQAVSLLDDLDKELNNYVMRCREWYGWHFPEMAKRITDNLKYVELVKFMGVKENADALDFSDFLSEEEAEKLKDDAKSSMGTEVSGEDMEHLVFLCDQIIEMTKYRAQLFEYLQSRMTAIAPNLSILVGELVGARLISHAGSLLNLAKHPASTVQILGAEKALFRALKTHHDTPKYGLIYHAQLIGQSTTKLKGKMSRMLAAKAALACRVDALGDDPSNDLGIEHRAKLELRLKQLEEGGMRRVSGTGKMMAKWDRYENKSEVRQYDVGDDSTIPSTSKKRKLGESVDGAEAKPAFKKIKAEEVKQEPAPEEEEADEDENASPKKKSKKKKKKKRADVKEEEAAAPVEAEEEEEQPSPPKKKKKKKKAKATQEED